MWHLKLYNALLLSKEILNEAGWISYLAEKRVDYIDEVEWKNLS